MFDLYDSESLMNLTEYSFKVFEITCNNEECNKLINFLNENNIAWDYDIGATDDIVINPANKWQYETAKKYCFNNGI